MMTIKAKEIFKAVGINNYTKIKEIMEDHGGKLVAL